MAQHVSPLTTVYLLGHVPVVPEVVCLTQTDWLIFKAAQLMPEFNE